jgi:hypothetical protein
MEEKKTIRLDNSLATTALESVMNNPLYKDLMRKIGAFRLAHPDLSEDETQKVLGKLVRGYITNKKSEWRPKLVTYLGEIHRRSQAINSTDQQRRN